MYGKYKDWACCHGEGLAIGKLSMRANRAQKPQIEWTLGTGAKLLALQPTGCRAVPRPPGNVPRQLVSFLRRYRLLLSCSVLASRATLPEATDTGPPTSITTTAPTTTYHHHTPRPTIANNHHPVPPMLPMTLIASDLMQFPAKWRSSGGGVSRMISGYCDHFDTGSEALICAKTKKGELIKSVKFPRIQMGLLLVFAALDLAK